jgi:hypothetical protein
MIWSLKISPLSKQQEVTKAAKQMLKRVLIQMKRSDTGRDFKYLQANAQLFIEFGISLLLPR